MMEKKAGSELRDTVAGLLEIKFNNVRIEERLTATTADVFYTDDLSTFPQNIAVECKDWSNPLTSSNLADIHSLYSPSLQSGEIDKLLIISNHELGMSPSETVKRLANTRYLQFDRFVHGLMNFQLLLQHNLAAFKNHEASQNYVQPRLRGTDVSLFETVEKWLVEPNNPVSMVYGGYGVGKTSFSLFLADALTKKYRSGQFDRIPIRIALGHLFTKQDLKALVCSELTGAEGQPAVANFTFELFLQMLNSGSIFLILDGFDEMRHAMSVEDFAYTFEQMSVFFRGKSKAIILGRPDAFFDEQEETDVVDALLSNAEICSDGLRKFEVDLFSRQETEEYIGNFKASNQLTDEELQLIDDLQDSEFEILSRPVQLSMFTKVTRTYSKRRNGPLTRYKLYEEFVKRFTQREEEKPARSVLDKSGGYQVGYSDPRSQFMQNLAWWISSAHRENRFLPSEIPMDTLPQELRRGRNQADALREALVGSIAEHNFKQTETGVVGRKGANYYYFPHKSYIEFLVSQYFCRVPFSKEMYRNFFKFANPEMISFVKEGPNIGAQNITLGMQHVISNVPRDLISIGTQSEKLRENAQSMMKGELTDANRYLLYELFIQSNAVKDIERLLLFSVNNARVSKRISTALRLNRDYLLRYSSATYAERLVANSLFASSAVRIKEVSEAAFKPGYMDGTFIPQLVLGKCLQRHKSQAWSFDPLALDELNDGETSSGLRCEDYGQYVNQNITGMLLTVRPTEIWSLLSNDYTSSFARAEVKNFLQL
ncbi:NACHT domain-containing protein [Pacificibacter marinus]|uniref:NACHT domain protein n=1 Tax=Pacificibacter marinus TaxID=658057 RepID=A0A1Y5TVQ8_9RHOB|nr:hypothetical protein [Pacificibacter marinus]SEL36867.1 hypothetical protein SAMN04488032_12026 [Pacificibacter marinus]SLN69539.1 hypothetical protein PAM7971_03718 [Pacificibacter marinus]